MRLRYRLTKSLIMLPAMFAAVAAFGQSHHLHLDNYTIPVAKKGALIGKLYDQKTVPAARKYWKTLQACSPSKKEPCA